MRRFISEKLDEWVERGCEKPLILHGARQVGKTWLMKDLGERLFENVVYISFDNDKAMRSLFNEDFNIERILLGIQAITQQTITPKKTLLIFDEIQECPNARTAIKFLVEEGRYDFIESG
ncbi:MAG: AAA family ATPase, partial [Actinomycetaceae bacterium]|nr:AAA family ATPase [Actinomycetaceae bacterium]